MSHSSILTTPLWHLVEESLLEAEYLWTRLDQSLDAHDHTLAEVEAWVEGRLLGALDGVLLAGASVVDRCLIDALEQRDLGMVSAAAYVLATLGDPAADRTLHSALRQVTEPRATAIARGLGRAGRMQALHALWDRSYDAPALARAVLLEALSFCGEAPHANWSALLNDPEPRLRHAAASALRFVSAVDLDTYAGFALSSQDGAVRARATSAGVTAGSARCWRSCLQQLEHPDAHSGPLLLLAALMGSAREIDLVIEALKEPVLCRDALWALGFAGTISAIEACLAQIEAGAHARLACEAVCAITGLDLHAAQLVQSRTVHDPDPDDPDAVLVPAADDLFPAPEVEGLRRWWAVQAPRFEAGVPYLGGRPKTLSTLCHALEHGPTRRRHALALELAARSGGTRVIQTLDLCRNQRQQLQRAFEQPHARPQDVRRSLALQPLAEA